MYVLNQFGKNCFKILIVFYQENLLFGCVGQEFVKCGFSFDICKFWFGDSFFGMMCVYVGVVIFGGLMSVNDLDGFI